MSTSNWKITIRILTRDMDMATEVITAIAEHMEKSPMKKKRIRETMLVRLISALVVVMAVMGLHAQAANQQAAPASTASLPPVPPSLPISFGDLLEVTVFDTPELS